MTSVLVLGGGMVGSVMAADLAAEPRFQVTVADARPEALERLRPRFPARTVAADLSDAGAVRRLAGEHELVLGALPSVLGLQTLRAVLEAGRDYVDISFMPEDPLELAPLAERQGVTAVVDCGVAPGLSNMLCGRAAAELSPCERLAIYVGGLPAERRWPWQYKAGFAPADVLEEYIRPARQVESGRVVVKEALSEPELLDFPGVGTLEAFNTDGLRTLLTTLQVPEMTEKTLRYPGHCGLMRVLREAGFLRLDPVEVGGQTVRPRDLTAALLFPRWAYADGEADLTVLRVVAEGRRGGQPARLQWDLLDRYDPATGWRSMSRTTAFPATIVARLIAGGRFRRPGVHAPEALGREPGVLDVVLAELERRGVRLARSG